MDNFSFNTPAHVWTLGDAKALLSYRFYPSSISAVALSFLLKNKTTCGRVSILTRIGVSDLIGLVGVQPDLLLAAAQDAGGQPLLEPEHAAGHTHAYKTRSNI